MRCLGTIGKFLAIVLITVCLSFSADKTHSPKKNTQKAGTQSPEKHVAGARASSTKSGVHKSRRSKSRKRASWKRRGQQNIDHERAREIQQALIREHYLDGQPTGVWDQRSQKAMERFQADNGWQSKTVPDSRALIKLGLGPNHDDLLNPESAMTGPLQPTAANSHAAAASPSAATPAGNDATPSAPASAPQQ